MTCRPIQRTPFRRPGIHPGHRRVLRQQSLPCGEYISTNGPVAGLGSGRYFAWRFGLSPVGEQASKADLSLGGKVWRDNGESVPCCTSSGSIGLGGGAGVLSLGL